MITLRLKDSQGIIDTEFGNWLIHRVKAKLLSNINQCRLVNWDRYLTESQDLTRLYKKDYKTSELIIFAANNLVCKGTSGEITICFDNTKFVPGFDRLRLDTIIKTINYGTVDTKSCPIFSDTFNYFVKNIDSYVSLYYEL